MFTKQTLKIFWVHARKYPWQMAVIAFGALSLIAFQTYTPLLYRDLINLLSQGHSPDIIKLGTNIVIMILVLNFLRTIFWRSTNFVNAHFESRVMSDLVNTCYKYLQQHSIGFFNSNFVGGLVTKVKRFERSFEIITDQITFDLGQSVLITGAMIGIMVWQYPLLGFITLGWCILFIAFAYTYALFRLPYNIKRAKVDTHVTGQLADSITNNANIKLFTNYEKENARLHSATEEQFIFRKKSWNLRIGGEIIQNFSMIILEFVVIYLAIKQWQQGIINVGDIALLQIYLLRMFDKIWNVGKNVSTVYEALADANEMTEMLLMPHEIKDAPNAIPLFGKDGEIRFKDVSFTYEKGSAVLDNFSLVVAPGEHVALIGPSGGGKSTISKLLLRFFDVGSGEITIDGQNIANVTQDSLRAAISFVPQESMLFHRSLMENIRYAKPEASDEEVIAAAKLAHADEFITSFPLGYDTLVGERGVKLSGGERQRVAIARAILKDAPILVLDEATSSLDSESESYIQDSLKKLMKNRTTLIIAHRLSTIMQMDRIVVIENGAIIEEGKHKELLKVNQGLYQRLWGIQAGGFAE